MSGPPVFNETWAVGGASAGKKGGKKKKGRDEPPVYNLGGGAGSKAGRSRDSGPAQGPATQPHVAPSGPSILEQLQARDRIKAEAGAAPAAEPNSPEGFAGVMDKAKQGPSAGSQIQGFFDWLSKLGGKPQAGAQNTMVGMSEPGDRSSNLREQAIQRVLDSQRQGVDLELLEERNRVARSSQYKEGDEYKQMTWEEYNKLSSRDKAAIDVNTYQNTAVTGDKEAARRYGGQDKRYTLDEVDPEKRAAYRHNYERLYGKLGRADNEIIFAPKTVAMLSRVLGGHSEPAGLDEYLAGGGYITDDELKHGITKKGPEGVPIQYQNVDARTNWVNRLVDYQEGLTKALKNNAVEVGGLGFKINTNRSDTPDLGKLIDSAASTTSDKDQFGIESLLARGQGQGTGRLELGSLLAGNQSSEVQKLNTTFDRLAGQMLQNGDDLKYMTDKTYMTKIAKGMNLNSKRWLELAKNRKAKTEVATASAADEAIYGKKA